MPSLRSAKVIFIGCMSLLSGWPADAAAVRVLGRYLEVLVLLDWLDQSEPYGGAVAVFHVSSPFKRCEFL